MSDEDDLELLALQRQLDDAFETTRPRRGFEDELWLRLQARRPLWSRLQDGLAGLVEGLREVPAVPAGAVAVVLILVIGIGVVSLSGIHLGGGTASSTTSQAGGAQFNPAQMAPAAFGHLPAVALYPGVPFPRVSGGPLPADAAQSGAPPIPTNVYFGPATLSWTGQLPAALGSTPVYRYREPSTTQANQFAASLGAAPTKQAGSAVGYLGRYTAQGFTLSVSNSWSTPPREPRFFLVPNGTQASGTDPTQLANALLAANSLVPTWPNTVSVATTGNQTHVQFLRAFQLPTGDLAYLVGGLGDRYGTDVVLQDGGPVIADGPLPLTLDSANYSLISPAQAAQLAVASSPSGPQVFTPRPTVQLDTVELVYALAFSGDQGFYEPAYLFTGSFQYQGQTMTKRLLVPAVNASP